MIFRIRTEDVEWFRAHPQMWWANAPRWALGRIATSPAVETDSDGEPTGWMVDADPRYDLWDKFILDVCLAGMAYAKALGPEQARALVQMQAQKDHAAFRALADRVTAGQITKDHAKRAVKLEVIRQAGALGVPLPEFDDDLNIVAPEPEPEPKPEPERPAESDLKALWVAYAEALGVDTGDMTKAEIIAAVDA